MGRCGLTNVLLTSLIEHFVMTAMQDAALKALISDLGEGIVIDPELLEGCSVAAHDLDDMVASVSECSLCSLVIAASIS